MAPATIAFDSTPTITGTTGIARYARELAAAFEALPEAVEVRRFAVGRASAPVDPAIAHARLPLRCVEPSWARGGPPRVERLVGPVRSVHAAGPALPTARAPIVAVVYDLAPLDHPHLHPRRSVEQLRRYVARIPRAKAVVTISQATADRLAAEVDGVPIHVTPLGRTPLPAPVASPLAGVPYVLAVGTPVPRKGFDLLVRAAAELPADVQVVIVGAPGPVDEELVELAEGLGVRHRLHRPSAVSDAALAGWYESAAVVAVPSHEEGFSLPVLEAQAAGTPVVATDIPVHREVAGRAAELVAPDDVGALVEALDRCLAGGEATDRLVREGHANEARFTWAACAEATLAVHRAVSG